MYEDRLLGAEEDEEGPGGIEEEVDQFMDEKPIKRSNDPLKWWKDNAERFPRLAAVAVEVLCIPTTSTSS